MISWYGSSLERWPISSSGDPMKKLPAGTNSRFIPMLLVTDLACSLVFRWSVSNSCETSARRVRGRGWKGSSGGPEGLDILSLHFVHELAVRIDADSSGRNPVPLGQPRQELARHLR